MTQLLASQIILPREQNDCTLFKICQILIREPDKIALELKSFYLPLYHLIRIVFHNLIIKFMIKYNFFFHHYFNQVIFII